MMDLEQGRGTQALFQKPARPLIKISTVRLPELGGKEGQVIDAAHAGQRTTELRVRLRYYFRNITAVVRDFVQACDAFRPRKLELRRGLEHRCHTYAQESGRKYM